MLMTTVFDDISHLFSFAMHSLALFKKIDVKYFALHPMSQCQRFIVIARENNTGAEITMDYVLRFLTVWCLILGCLIVFLLVGFRRSRYSGIPHCSATSFRVFASRSWQWPAAR
jgi:hypothetical protein